MCADLVIDIGHARIKWGRVRNGLLEADSIGHGETESPNTLVTALDRLDCKRALLSGQSRPGPVAQIADLLRQTGLQVDIMTTGDRPLPVAPAYESLGCDRWLALQKPRLEGSGPFVVIDSGTAITVDLVDGKGHHQGGWIMAGIQTARSGLFARAPGLDRPLPGPEDVDEPARDTGSALSRGSLMLAAGGIDRAVRAAERAVEEHVSLWLTGGNAAELAPLLAQPARHDQHLVLHGLAIATQSK